MTQWLEIDDASAVSAARRLARLEGAKIDFPNDKLEEVAIVASEAATNILRHAGRGRMLAQVLERAGRRSLALLAIDRGPGIPDLERMMRDGESTIGSAGAGLGAIRRLSDRFEIHALAGEGTVIACEFERGGASGLAGTKSADPSSISTPSDRLDFAGLYVNHPTEAVCGDAWTARRSAAGVDLLVCDGLGHGPGAAEAASAAVAAFGGTARLDPSAALTRISEGLEGTRGAVASFVRLSAAPANFAYAGVGNIATLHIRDGVAKRMAVRDGRLGAEPVSPHAEEFDLEPGDLIILHSDGLGTIRDLETRLVLLRRSPLLIAGALLDRHFRGRDDASVVVARVREE